MPGTMQTLHAQRGFGCIRDTEGATVFFRASVPTVLRPRYVSRRIHADARWSPALGPSLYLFRFCCIQDM